MNEKGRTDGKGKKNREGKRERLKGFELTEQARKENVSYTADTKKKKKEKKINLV